MGRVRPPLNRGNMKNKYNNKMIGNKNRKAHEKACDCKRCKQERRDERRK